MTSAEATVSHLVVEQHLAGGQRGESSKADGRARHTPGAALSHTGGPPATGSHSHSHEVKPQSQLLSHAGHASGSQVLQVASELNGALRSSRPMALSHSKELTTREMTEGWCSAAKEGGRTVTEPAGEVNGDQTADGKRPHFTLRAPGDHGEAPCRLRSERGDAGRCPWAARVGQWTGTGSHEAFRGSPGTLGKRWRCADGGSGAGNPRALFMGGRADPA